MVEKSLMAIVLPLRFNISFVVTFFLCVMLELPQDFLEKLRVLNITESPRVLIVHVVDQKLTLFENHQVRAEWAISTARNGTGQKLDSYQTPLGLHRIKEKIGKDAPQGAVFESREFKGQIWIPPTDSLSNTNLFGGSGDGSKGKISSTPDLVTSRVLWLEGLEPGYNAGNDTEGNVVGSYQRYIYIHGTNHEDEIGKSASRGCIRMKNSEVIDLFDLVQEGDLVWIQ